MLEKLNDLNNKDKLTLFCGFVVLVCVIFIFSTDNISNNVPVKEEKVDNINEIINNRGDNYTLTINETLGEDIYEHIFYEDSKLKLYESTTSEFGFLKYDNKLFVVDGETKKLQINNKDASFINSFYYDYDFIKEFTKSCEYEYVLNNKVQCKLSLNEYLKYYNNRYNTNYSGNDYEFIDINISYGKKIKTINIDYSLFDKLINADDKKHIVDLSFNYTKNDFSEIYDNYKDVLES